MTPPQPPPHDCSGSPEALAARCAELEREVAELRQFRELIDNLPYGVGLWQSQSHDPGEMVLRYVNPRASLEWGTDVATKVGQTLRTAFPEALNAPAPYNLAQTWNRVARSGTPETVDPLPYGPLDHPDGWLRAHTIPAGPGMAAMVFDNVSRHIRAERQLRSLNNELEKRVRERTGRLDDVNKELEAFSYTVSHDLRAPLRAIRGFAQALQEDFGDSLDPDATTYLQHILDGAESMRERIQGLLALSRLTRHEISVEPVSISLRAEKVFSRLPLGDRQVEVSIQPDLEVRADPRLVDLLLENLFSNALKFTVTREVAHIEFGLASDQDRTRFYVRDNGIGFDNRHAQKMYRPFHRLHSDTRFPGTGIGLATVQRIVKMHGGSIRADGRPGEGATFWFTL